MSGVYKIACIVKSGDTSFIKNKSLHAPPGCLFATGWVTHS